MYNSVYLYIVAGCCPFFVSSCLCFHLVAPSSLSILLFFCLSHLLGLLYYYSLPSLPWFGTFFPSFVSFFFLFLFLFITSVYCSLFPLWTLSSGRVSICCCSLRPRNLYLSGRKHRYGIWLYWVRLSE